MSKTKLSITTPVGKLEWVDIEGQGRCFGDYNQDEAKFFASVVIAKKDFEGSEFKAKVDEFHKQHGHKGKPCYRQYVERVYDEDGSGDYEEVKTEDYVIKAKTNAYFNGKPNYIKVTDSKGSPFPRGHFVNDKIGNGSTGRIAITVMPYNVSGNKGTTAFLNALQVAKIVPYEGAVKFDEIEGDTCRA